MEDQEMKNIKPPNDTCYQIKNEEGPNSFYL